MTDIDKQIESLGYEIRVSDLSCCYIVYENKDLQLKDILNKFHMFQN